MKRLTYYLRRAKDVALRFWHKSYWTKVFSIFVMLIIVATSTMFGIAQWYISRHQNELLTYGATFIPSYAESMGLNAQDTMQAMIDDLGIRRFRLVSYWKEIEKEQGRYDFSRLDWQFDKANKAGAKVSLAVGLRQPRWPECHMPEWAPKEKLDDWYPHLKDFISAVVNRYKDNPALESYQLENEYFLSVFGDCPVSTRERLVEEFNLVKSIDPDRTLIVSRSNNAVPSWPIGDPRADLNAASIYKRVWDKTITRRYFEYPLPAWYYGFLAGATELSTGTNTFIHELQTEPWLPEGYSLTTASVNEMYKSMNPRRLKAQMDYAEATGMRTIDLWGPEWWYYMKEKRNTPEMWDTAKKQLAIRTAK